MKQIIYFLSLLVLMTACTATVESENKLWERNTTTLAKYKSNYSGVANYLDDDLNTATATWEKALSLSNEEDKIKQMGKANSQISDGLLGLLKKMETSISDLKKAEKQLASYSADEYTPFITNTGFVRDGAEAQQRMSYIDRNGFDGSSRIDVEVEIKRLTMLASTSTKAYKDIIEKVENKRSEKENTTTTSEKSTASSAPASCDYCGNKLAAEATRCSGCGADVVGAVANSSEVAVKLEKVGAQKLMVVKVVKQLTGKSLKDAKQLVDQAPSELAFGISTSEAKAWKEQLEKVGATVSIK